MSRYIAQDFLFPSDFKNFDLQVRLRNCPADFSLSIITAGKVRHYKYKSKIKKVFLYERYNGFFISGHSVTLEFPKFNPVPKNNMIVQIDRAVKGGKFEPIEGLSPTDGSKEKRTIYDALYTLGAFVDTYGKYTSVAKLSRFRYKNNGKKLNLKIT